MRPKSFYFTRSLMGGNYQTHINFVYSESDVKSIVILSIPKGMELKKEYSLEGKFNSFNDIFSKMINGYKPLYAIAFYDMCTFQSLTGEVSDNYDELKKIYDEKYAWKPNQIGVTEYHYEIIVITTKIINKSEIDYKKKYEEYKKKYEESQEKCNNLVEKYNNLVGSLSLRYVNELNLKKEE